MRANRRRGSFGFFLIRNHIRKGLVVDLGCARGIWAAELLKAGYEVFGIDASRELIRLARRRAPQARFRVESFFDAEIPRCAAVTSIGKCFNYARNPSTHLRRLRLLFERVHSALIPGGLFIFDIAGPGQCAPARRKRDFLEGEDWAGLVEKEEGKGKARLSRRIITFRKAGRHYRRSEEAQLLRLFNAAETANDLRGTGFTVRVMRRRGGYFLRPASASVFARKIK